MLPILLLQGAGVALQHNGTDPVWDIVLKITAIVVPIFTGLTLFGVAQGMGAIGNARKEMARMARDLAELKGSLQVRVETAAADHRRIDERLDEHDDMLENHGHRIAVLEGGRTG